MTELTDEQIDAVTLAQWGQDTHPLAAHRTYARAIIAAHEAQRPAYQEPTEEMLRAGCLSQQATPEYDNYEDWSNSHSGGTVERIRGYMRKDYLAMVAAAPQPAVEPLTDAQIDAVIKNWFAEDWAIENARGMLRDLGIGEA